MNDHLNQTSLPADLTEKLVSQETLYTGRVVSLTKDTVSLPNGRTAVREILHHRGSVAIVPVTDAGEVVLEEQYRYAAGQILTEIPAGKLEPEEAGANDTPESRLAAARRELAEETGLRAREMILLGDWYGSPGVLAERMTMYIAFGLTEGDTRPDEDEFIRLRRVPLEKAEAAVLRGEIPDGKTQAGVLRAVRWWGNRLEAQAAHERALMPAPSVLFDLDGTITDPGEGITNSVAHALRRMGVEPPPREELYAFIGPPLAESFRRRYSMSVEESTRAVEYFREYFADTGIYENAPYDGIREALDELRVRGYRIYLATSKPDVFARRVLLHFGLADRFDFIVGADMGEKLVRKADIVRRVLELTGADPTASWMVGDRSNDIEGARANRVPAIGVTWGYGSEEELTAAGADKIARTPEEMVRIIAGMNNEK